jgi:hypothetical protein
MNWLVRLLFPSPLSFGGSGGGDSGGNMQADEARKSALRSKIDAMYGIAPGGTPAAPAKQQAGRFGVPVESDAAVGPVDDNSSVASDAAKQMAADRTNVSDATRGYYTDQLARSFGGAERNARFRLARQGLMGGSADVDTHSELQTDENLGATRIDQASRAAAASLDQQREQERLNAISLVNSGAGESAVASAQSGLKNSLANVTSAQRANLFGDLFTAGANSYTASNQDAALAAMLGRYNQQLSYFGNSSGGSAGRITPSGG